MNINKPELETLDYKPEKPAKCSVRVCPKCGKTFSLYMKDEFIDHTTNCPDQPPEQLIFNKCKHKGEFINCCPETCKTCCYGGAKTTDQPNTNAMIIKTIQGLITVIINNIAKLPNSKLRGQALEDIDLFEKTTLYELQRSFE